LKNKHYNILIEMSERNIDRTIYIKLKDRTILGSKKTFNNRL